MKQKNLILMVVAVGCGLAAALLTSSMSAKLKDDAVEVIVASKDLPVGTMLTKETIATSIARKKMPKDALPPALVLSEEELVDKRLTRGVRAAETFNPADLSKGGVVTIPHGMNMMTIPCGLTDAVAGFAGPGSRVDILATYNQGPKKVAFPLLVDMLVLTINSAVSPDTKGNGTFTDVSMVSFAVTRESALLLKLAQERSCRMTLVLRHDEQQQLAKKEEWKYEDVKKLLEDGDRIEMGKPVAVDDPEKRAPSVAGPAPAAEKVELVTIPVATADVARGTVITAEVLKKNFEKKEFAKKDAPANAVADLETLIGKSFLSDVAANQFVAKSQVGDPVKVAEVKPAVATKPKRTHDVIVQTGSGNKTFRYEEKSAGEWVIVGEVKPAEGENKPTPPAAEPTPTPTPDVKVD